MSLNDPFFDAWVRDKLQHAEVRTPEHLWEVIRRRSRFYNVGERNKYLPILLVLLFVTGSVGYWAFHPVPPNTDGKMTPGLMAESSPVLPRVPAAAPNVMAPTHAGGPPPLLERKDPLDRTNGLVAAALAPLVFQEPTRAAPAFLSVVPAGNDLTLPVRSGGLPPLRTSELTQWRTNDLTPPRTSVEAPPLLAGPQRRHTYLEIYAGPDHVTHYIKASSPAYAGYVRQAMNIEVGYPSFSIGLRLDMPVISDNWRLQWGIHYAQINEQLHYFNPSVNKTVSQVTTRSVVQASGNTVQVTDTSVVTYKGQYLKQSLNAYRMIDIPLLVSYTFYRNTQFQLGGSAGAFFNVVSRYNGDILDTNLLPTALHTGTGSGVSSWKSSIGTSLYGSLSLHDQLTRHVQVGLEPYLRYELGSVNRNVSVYRERFVTTGLALSIRYALGR